MRLSEITGKKVALLGAGKENLSLIPLLQLFDAQVTLCDKDENFQFPNITLNCGQDYLSHLDQFDVIFRSPGLPVAFVDQALEGKANQPQRTSAIDLFLANYPHRVIGVTGTKGKGTTSSMIAAILKTSGRLVYLAGNIGTTIFNDWSKLISNSDGATEVILELSSFQLEDVQHSPAIAVLTPITEDHLQPLSDRSPNYHLNQASYWEAKKGITKFQDSDSKVIYAADFPGCQAVAEASLGKLYGISTMNISDQHLTNDGKLQTFDHTGELKNQLDLTQAGLRGRHLLLDGALAALTAKTIGIDDQTIIQGLKSWQPLPHRMEKLSDTGAITVVDDSYATTPDATLAALTSFNSPIIWLGGGSSKGADFTKLAKALAHQAKKVIVIGQEASHIISALEKTKAEIPMTDCGSDFNQAVRLAVGSAQAGDVILLSPACASKDMFTDANDRGEQFQKLVRQNLGADDK